MKIIKLLVLLIIFVLLTVFCVRNSSIVTVDYLAGKLEIHFYLAILAAFLLGAFVLAIWTGADWMKLIVEKKRLQKHCRKLSEEVKRLSETLSIAEVKEKESLSLQDPKQTKDTENKPHQP